MKICVLFGERGRKRREREQDKKKNEDKVVLLPRKLWMHRPSLDTAAKGQKINFFLLLHSKEGKPICKLH